MSDRATLLALAERCEQAAGPDRELDVAIAFACGIVTSRDGDCFYGHKDHSVVVLDRDYYDHDGNAPALMPFSASLDAAVTLVPEGWGWAVSTTGAGLPCAYGHPPGNGLAVAWIDDTPAATPALAMCAFALRARAAAYD
jgi:hypothetical protein